MSNEPDITQRKYLYDEITRRFEKTHNWHVIEPIAAVQVASFPEPTSPETKERLLEGIIVLKKMLQELGIDPQHLSFLDEELERHRNTRQITLFVEKEDYVDADTLDRFCHKSYDMQEGVVGINKPYNYGQLRRITQHVYRQTGNIKFYISDETVIRGKIDGEIYDYLQDIPVASVYMPMVHGDEMSQTFLFGDVVDKKKWRFDRDITAPFHVYTFVDDNMREYVLLSVDAVELGDYEVHGTMLKINDRKKLSESSRIPTKLPFIFLHHAVGTVVKYNSEEEYLDALAALNIRPQVFFNYPFVLTIDNKVRKSPRDPEHVQVVMKHPKWFKWLIWGWLCHNPKGPGTRYPLPLTIVGPPKSGKSTLLERISEITLESQPIFKGEDSKIKGVIPSFHSTPPKRGYLCTSRRVSLMDEFYRCLIDLKDVAQRSESLATMNSILEHKNCYFGSGTGSIKLKMHARAFFANNPPRGVHNVEDLLRIFDSSFNSRTLIVYQKEDGEHVQMIRQSKERDLRAYVCNLKKEEFASFLDYFWTFSSTWDQNIIDDIYEEPIPVLTELQRNHYEPRHKHHLECLFDGIIKARALTEGSCQFHATKEDYAVMREVWGNIIRGWTDGERVRTLPLNIRAHYIPEKAQWLWNQITATKRVLLRADVEALADEGLTKPEFYTAYTILRVNGLVDDEEEPGFIKPYYLMKKQSEEQQTLTTTKPAVYDDD